MRSAIPAVVTNADNRVVDCNRAAREILGCDIRGCQAGNLLFDLLEARDGSGNRLVDCHVSFMEVLSQGEPYRQFEIQVRKPCGEVRRVAVSVVIILDADGAGKAYVYFLETVLRRRRADEVIERILSDPKSAETALESWSEKHAPAVALTPRQLEILVQLAEGLTDQQIASSLCISVHTVRNHVRAILETLGVHNRPQAVAQAYRHRLI